MNIYMSQLEFRRTKQRLLLLMAVVFSILLNLSILKAESNATPVLTQASDQARATGKLLSILVTGNDSTATAKMQELLLSDQEIQKLIKDRFIYLEISIFNEAKLVENYGLKRFPSLLILDADCNERGRIVGFVPQASILASLRNALDQPSSPSLDSSFHGSLMRGASLESQKRYAEALDEYIKCLDHIPQGNIQLQIAVLKRLQQLASRYPLALEKIDQRRVAIESSIAGKSPEASPKIFAFNNALGQPERNLALYDSLPAGSPQRQQLFSFIFKQLVQQRRYADAVSARDLETFINQFYPFAPHQNSSHAASRSKSIQEMSACAVEALLAVGQTEKAKRIAGRALEQEGIPNMRLILSTAASQSGGDKEGVFAQWIQAYPQANQANASRAPQPQAKTETGNPSSK